MIRVLVASLVFTLSGVPAAAIVCDLMVCVERVTPAPLHGGCHDHSKVSARGRIASRAADCTHLSTIDAYVAGARSLDPVLAAGMALELSHPALAFRRDPSRNELIHGPPGARRSPAFLTLRI